ncbi:Nif3-like dinuclear metal center hexameric protein, partial [Enterococcus faecalis]|uniref:Nif3-like dinuclear metal center hexameric protein n=1 Tax=Enterococcus faecalis TaxID=1351 RepID=UPI003CC67D64
YITGDVYYHTAHDMFAVDLPVIDPAHYIEALCKPKLVEFMNQWKQENEWAVSIIESEANSYPFRFKYKNED